MKIKVEANAGFKEVDHSKKRYIVMKGSAGSGKSMDTAQNYIIRLMNDPGRNLLCVRKADVTNRDSTFTINGTVYQFKFGMGFLREANRLTKIPVQGMPGTTKEIGARYLIASVVVDQEPNALVDLLDLANKGENPRVTKAMLDSYIDSEEVDIDELMEKTKDFLSKANATKKAVKEILKEYEEQMAKKKAQEL